MSPLHPLGRSNRLRTVCKVSFGPFVFWALTPYSHLSTLQDIQSKTSHLVGSLCLYVTLSLSRPFSAFLEAFWEIFFCLSTVATSAANSPQVLCISKATKQPIFFASVLKFFPSYFFFSFFVIVLSFMSNLIFAKAFARKTFWQVSDFLLSQGNRCTAINWSPKTRQTNLFSVRKKEKSQY